MTQKNFTPFLGRNSKYFEGMLSAYISKWIPSIRAAIPINTIIQNLEYAQFSDESILFKEGDKIHNYIFLAEGAVNCYKHKQVDTKADALGTFIKQIGQPSAIIQNIFSHHEIRYASCKAQGLVKCYKIECGIIKKLCTEVMNENQEIEKLFSEYLNIKLHSIRKYQIIKHFKYVRLPLRTKLILENQRKQSTNSIYFLLEGQCKVTTRSHLKNTKVSSSMLQHKINQYGLITLSKYEFIGLEILFEDQYNYNYMITTETAELLEIKDIDINNFPQEMKFKLEELYNRQSQHVKNIISTEKLEKFNKENQYTCNLTKQKSFDLQEKKELKQLCMYITRSPSNHIKINQIKSPESLFIPKKKQRKNVLVKMRRKDWSQYIHLPSIKNSQA